jgi:hypothetical protein
MGFDSSSLYKIGKILIDPFVQLKFISIDYYNNDQVCGLMIIVSDSLNDVFKDNIFIDP